VSVIAALLFLGAASAQQEALDLQQITIRIPAGTPEAERTARVEAFTAATRTITACSQVESVARQVQGEVVLGKLTPDQLPVPLRVQLERKPAGTVSQVFGGDEGVWRVVIRC
jgi:hypothetical protein